MVQALHRALPERGIGVWSFDFPAHGDSPMGQEGLRVPCFPCPVPLVTGPGPSCVRRR